MPSGDGVATPSQVREIWIAELRGLLEATTVQIMRQAAREWGWALKGTAKSDLIEQMIGYLGDAPRMAAAIKTLPEEELAVLSWFSALGSGSGSARQLKAALVEGGGARLSQKAIDGHLQDLAGRCLILFNEEQGYRLPDLYREWLPRPATPKLMYATPGQLQTPSPAMTVAAITQHAQQLLSALTAEQPQVTLAPKSAPSYRSGKPDPIDPRRPSLVAADILARWGYGSETEQHLARFLLEQMVAARLCRVSQYKGSSILHPPDLPSATWEMATAMERLQRLRRAYLTLSRRVEGQPVSWSEWDMAFPQMKGVRLQPTAFWVTTAQLIQQVRWVGVWLSNLVTSLEAETWYSVEQLYKLIYHVQRDLLIPGSQQSWWTWVIDGQSLDPSQITFDLWMRTSGRVIEAWLTGPASWLLMVQVGYAHGRPAAFRRPGVLPAGEAEPPPPDSLRFMPDGVIGLTNDWRASDLRRLLRLMSVEVARDAATTLLRLDTDAFRQSLRAGQDAAYVATIFADAGFPLPQEVQETLQTWQSRAGRYQLYDQMTVVEFGEDVLPEEIQAISQLSRVEYYQPGPRCLIFPDSQVAPALVEELRRRGYTPQVLS